MKKWKRPLKCRVFGCRYEDTEYKIKVFFILESPLELCSKCGGCRVFNLGGYKYFAPEAYLRFVEQRKIETGEAGKNVVPFRLSAKTE